MFFFKNPIQKFDLKIGIREILVDYISKKDTIVSGIDDRIVRFWWKEDILLIKLLVQPYLD